ncbi:MAG: biopolymer transporter ExbD [Methylococcaceae bacterium]|nr:biopolymer transporter ExbD [Methylococcaceae bacterium]
MAFKTHGDENEAVSDINITPLVDVMLVLVIILMVTAPLLTQVVDVTLPKTVATQPNTKKDPLILEVAGNCQSASAKITLNKTPVTDLASLDGLLKDELSRNPEVVVNLNADDSIPYGKVAEVIAVTNRAGISRIAFVTMEK